MTEKLVILNLSHPRGSSSELANNPEQRKSSVSPRRFQQEGAHRNLTAGGLTFWIKDPAAKPRYVEAQALAVFRRVRLGASQSFRRQAAVEPAE